jgi:hypothetical protein
MATLTRRTRSTIVKKPFLSLVLLAIALILHRRSKNHSVVAAFSFDPSFLDRFRATCPAHPSCIGQFDPQLVSEVADSQQQQQHVWVAVYRSSTSQTNNNKPSVFVRDEFFQAMTDATTTATTTTTTTTTFSETTVMAGLEAPPAADSPSLLLQGEKPVAIARLRPSDDFEATWILDTMRCSLRKEEQDETCDGGSEYLEALAVGVDSLLLHYLRETVPTPQKTAAVVAAPIFEGAIRTKATLFSGKILEARGLQPVETLSKDMATHVSAYDSCLNFYAHRTVATTTSATTATTATALSSSSSKTSVALQIVSLLGQLDREDELQKAAAGLAAAPTTTNGKENEDGTTEPEYDPFAGFNSLNRR